MELPAQHSPQFSRAAKGEQKSLSVTKFAKRSTDLRSYRMVCIPTITASIDSFVRIVETAQLCIQAFFAFGTRSLRSLRASNSCKQRYQEVKLGSAHMDCNHCLQLLTKA